VKTFLLSLILFTSIFLFAVFSATAQNLGDGLNKNKSEKNLNKPENKFNIGFNASPQFTDISDLTGNGNSNGIGFFAAAFFEYKILSKLKIRVTMSYDRRAFKIRNHLPFAVFSDTISYNSSSTIDVKYNVDYFTIPLSIIYVAGTEKLRFIVKGSFYYSFYITAYQNGYTDLYIYPDDYQFINPELDSLIVPGHNIVNYSGRTHSLLDKEPFNSYDIGFEFSLGIEYCISRKVILTLSPGICSSFGRLLENPYYNNTKWSRNMNIETGIIYKILK
jgi:hypothetical protein